MSIFLPRIIQHYKALNHLQRPWFCGKGCVVTAILQVGAGIYDTWGGGWLCIKLVWQSKKWNVHFKTPKPSFLRLHSSIFKWLCLRMGGSNSHRETGFLLVLSLTTFVTLTYVSDCKCLWLNTPNGTQFWLLWRLTDKRIHLNISWHSVAAQ